MKDSKEASTIAWSKEIKPLRYHVRGRFLLRSVRRDDRNPESGRQSIN